MTARHYRATPDDVLTAELRARGWQPGRILECGCTKGSPAGTVPAALCVAHAQMRAVLHYHPEVLTEAAS